MFDDLVESVIQSPDDRIVVVVYRNNGTHIYDAKTHELMSVIEKKYFSIIFSPNSKMFAAFNDWNMVIVDTVSKNEIFQMDCRDTRADAMIFTPDSEKLIVYNSNIISIIDVNTNKVLTKTNINGLIVLIATANYMTPLGKQIKKLLE